MFAAGDPNLIIGGLAVGGLALYALWGLIAWVRRAPVRPDPWDAEIEKQLSGPDAVEVCPHCLTEQSSTAWFCRKCGSAVGPYNNLMPYVHIFSEGEVFRNGVAGRFRNRPLVLVGFILISLSTYFVFLPVYLFVLLASWRRSSGGTEFAGEQKNQ
jgi:ribosomal protein L40E